MWIGRATVAALKQRLMDTAGQLDETKRRLAASEERVVLLRTAAAVQQQNFDWLTHHVNRLESERSTLLERVLGLAFTAPQIQKIDTPERPVFIGAPIDAEDRPEGEDTGMALSAMMAGSFEDMGDAAAEQLGVKHDPGGNLSYTR